MNKSHALLFAATGLVLAALVVGTFVVLQPLFSSGDAGISGQVKTSGTALVGGPFELTDHTGRTVTEKDFRGKHMLIYFGYSYCPDVCPGELQVAAAALDALGDKAAQVQPIFITVDPERDTVEHLAGYVENFHERLIGLTGTADQIAQAAKAYRVYYAKVDDPDSSEYLMDHSSIFYLMGPEGGFLAHFPYGTKPQDMADKISGYLGK